MNLPKKKLIQNVPTRWNSTFHLLQRLLEMKNAIVLYATDYNLQVPTANEWKLMENVIRLLQPFEEHTKLLSSNNAPISVVIPAVAVLQHYLNKDDGEKSAGVRTMKQEFHNAVKSRFENVITNENYVVATTVDPRFKLENFRGLLKKSPKVKTSVPILLKNQHPQRTELIFGIVLMNWSLPQQLLQLKRHLVIPRRKKLVIFWPCHLLIKKYVHGGLC